MFVSTLRSLRYYRERALLTQGQLADMAGISRPTIYKLETGKRRPTPRIALALADALQVELGDLLLAPPVRAEGEPEEYVTLKIREPGEAA